MTEVEREPTKQPRMFVNLKSNLINHELESKLHVSLKQKDYIDKKESKLQSQEILPLYPDFTTNSSNFRRRRLEKTKIAHFR